MELAFQLWPAQNAERQNGEKRIALLHGMGGTGALWRPIAATLENDYSLIAFDQRGHGKSRISASTAVRSESENEYSPLDFGRDVVETLQATQFHPTWLIGHSMGVRTACAAAHLKPEWIQGLVLIDLGFAGPAGGGLGDGLGNFLRILPQTFVTREEARQFMNANCPDPSIAQYLMAVSVRAPDGSLTFPFEHSALIQTIAATRSISVRPWLREAGERSLPVLVLRGAESLVWSQADFEQERMAFKDLPSIVFEEFEGTGHGLPFEKRIEFCRRVDDFIRNAH